MTARRNLKGKALEQYKKTLKLTDEQRDIIIGCLLGDCTMGLRSGKPLYSLKFEQSRIRENYINHLAEIFADFSGSFPEKRWIDKQQTRQAIWFRTYRHDSLIFYFNLFYKVETLPGTGKFVCRKCVPQNIEKFLNPRVLAYWFMDDGTCHRNKKTGAKAYYLNTQGFEKYECQRLCDALHSKFNLGANVHKDKTYWTVGILQTSTEHFRQIILPYIVDDFQYKL